MKGIASVCLAGVIAALGGCGAPSLAVEIVQPAAYTAPTAAGQACTTTSAGSGATQPLAYGQVDMTVTNFQAWEPFELENHMASSTVDTATGQVSGAAFHAEKFFATYLGTDDATTSALAAVTAQVPINATVPADSGTWTGPLPLLPANVAQSVAKILNPPSGGFKTVVVRFYVQGVRSDGMSVTSSTYQYPIQIYNGGNLVPTCGKSEQVVSCYPGMAPYFCVAAP